MSTWPPQQGQQPNYPPGQAPQHHGQYAPAPQHHPAGYQPAPYQPGHAYPQHGSHPQQAYAPQQPVMPGGYHVGQNPAQQAPARPVSQGAENFNWLMTSFVDRTTDVDQAVVVSADGLLMAMARIDRASADRLSAIVTGVRSLADSASEVLARGDLNHVIIEMRTAYLLVSAISGGSSLGIVCGKDADLGLVGYEMSLLVQRVGSQLTPELITELSALVA
jgi:uncharacterized protein